MRLEQLDLTPYGRFANRSLPFSPGAALHVVFGANELGKTTTLCAIGDLLYGFRRDTTYAFEHDQRLLRIGGAFRLRDGSRVALRRRKGNKDTLLDAEDRPVSEEPLRRALGGVERETFENEFGLTALALRRGGEALLQAGGALAETLAAGSASLSALNDLGRRLATEADALFAPRRAGSKPFYVALDRHDAATRRLRDAVVDSDELSQAEAALLAAQAREVDLKAQHQENGRAIARRRRALRVAGKLAGLDAASREAETFADLPAFAASTLAEARKALAADALKRAELQRLIAEETRDDEARRGLGLDEALLARGPHIDALTQQLGAVRKDEEDLPRRVGAHVQARAQLDDLARRLGFADHGALLDFTPSDAALATLRALTAKRRDNERTRANSERRHEAAVAERRRLGDTAPATAIDPAPFKRRLDGFATSLAEAERLLREQALAAREAYALNDEVAALDPAVADLDGLARRRLPDMPALAARELAETAAEEARRGAEQARDAARKAMDTSAADLTARKSAAAGATRADWDAARARRDAAWQRLGAAFDGPLEFTRERLETVQALTLAADATVERVLADTERAARLQAARDAFDRRSAEFAAAESRLAAMSEARARAVAETGALWAPSGIAPRDCGAMTRWRARVAELLTRRAALETRKAELDALQAKVDAARAALLAWLSDAGATAPVSDAFEEAHRAARTRLDVLVELKQAARDGEAKRVQCEQAIAEWAGERDKAIVASERLAEFWGPAVSALRLPPQTSVEAAEAALDAWTAVALPRREFEDTTHRITAMRGDIAAFEREVAALATAAAPALAEAPARDALRQLGVALAAARRAAEERERLKREAERRRAIRRDLEADRAHLVATLESAREALSAPDDDALAVALERLQRRRALEEEQARLRRELTEVGDGLDENALREEAAGFDLSSLPAEIDVAEQGQSRLLNEIGSAAAAASAAEAARDALARGRDAIGAARERTEAAGELVDIAERWLARAAAARLAARAIERHRAAAQDPLVARAGELFGVATAGSFAGLGVGYDESDRPILVARRPQGQTVEVKGLSEGARDQLFLSLRLALLERRAGEPLPFIGDDLLASFDDERTLRTLNLLAEFGAGRQTILFTHHARVAELARSLNDRPVEVLEI